jgi:hypothetical protein
MVTSAGIFVICLACGSNTASPTPMGACGLVSNMDALVGKTAIDRPGGYSLNGFDRCTWVYGADPSRYVGVSFGPISGHSGAIDSLGPGEQVSGLGDDARWWAANHLLSVAMGQHSIQVDLQLSEAESNRQLAESIARAALANVH